LRLGHLEQPKIGEQTVQTSSQDTDPAEEGNVESPAGSKFNEFEYQRWLGQQAAEVNSEIPAGKDAASKMSGE